MSWAKDPCPSLHKLLSYLRRSAALPPVTIRPARMPTPARTPTPLLWPHRELWGDIWTPLGKGQHACRVRLRGQRLPLWTRPVSPALHSPPCPLSPTPSPQQSSSATLQPVAW